MQIGIVLPVGDLSIRIGGHHVGPCLQEPVLPELDPEGDGDQPVSFRGCDGPQGNRDGPAIDGDGLAGRDILTVHSHLSGGGHNVEIVGDDVPDHHIGGRHGIDNGLLDQLENIGDLTGLVGAEIVLDILRVGLA